MSEASHTKKRLTKLKKINLEAHGLHIDEVEDIRRYER